jgi:tetratricopeptide (TPR) repeat protein
VQRELKNDQGAVESLTRALQLDPGNVVAARLLADAYLALGEKLEALKKYKLVHALLPGDESLEAIIERLDNELNPITIAPAAAPEPLPAPPPPPPASEETSPFAVAPPPPPPAPPPDEMPWGEPETPAATPQAATAATPASDATGDSEPMHLAHSESPFEDPVAETYSSAAVEVEAPGGFHVDSAPLVAEVPSAPVLPSDESDVFAPAPAIEEPEEDITNTLTMADLYARQGLTDDARHIFESILQRDPDNSAVRDKLDALNAPQPAEAPSSPFAAEPEPVFDAPEPPQPSTAASPMPPARAKVARLENWLHKVAGREERDV